jgi:hypothetical protein
MERFSNFKNKVKYLYNDTSNNAVADEKDEVVRSICKEM